MANGRLYDAMTLEQLGNNRAPAPTPTWNMITASETATHGHN
jgi:hypothetical protein